MSDGGVSAHPGLVKEGETLYKVVKNVLGERPLRHHTAAVLDFPSMAWEYVWCVPFRAQGACKDANILFICDMDVEYQMRAI